MKLSVALFLTSLAAFGCASKQSVSSTYLTSPLAETERNRAAVVKVLVAPGGQGTGVIISRAGLVITAAHVVPVGRSVSVEMEDGGQVIEVSAEVLVRDRDLDIAILSIGRRAKVAAALSADESVVSGLDVYAIGHPAGEQKLISRGFVREVGVSSQHPILRMGYHDAIAVERIDGRSGASGSPVFASDSGLLVGILRAEETVVGRHSFLFWDFHSRRTTQILASSAQIRELIHRSGITRKRQP